MYNSGINCILVITYNQEDTIKQCLESLLVQKNYICKIIVQDDNSTDNTWNILETYKKKYSSIFDIYRNQENLGVFGNYNSILKKACGKIVSFVAGDDQLDPKVLKEFTELYDKESFNEKDSFLIYTNSILVGKKKETIVSNYKMRNNSMIENTLLCKGGIWDIGLSIELVKRMPEIRSNIGYQADWLQHFERVLCCEKNIFLDVPGYRYTLDSGVTVKEKREKQIKSKETVKKIFFSEYGSYLTKKVVRKFNIETALYEYLLNQSNKTYFIFIKKRLSFGLFPLEKEFDRFVYYIPYSIRILLKKVLKKITS